jgi:hypothetical protein
VSWHLLTSNTHIRPAGFKARKKHHGYYQRDIAASNAKVALYGDPSQTAKTEKQLSSAIVSITKLEPVVQPRGCFREAISKHKV